MARNRMLKKDFFGDPKVGSLPLGCRLLFQSLWIFADDTGNGIADARLLKAQCFPYDPDITPGNVKEWLDLLSKAAMVRQYEISAQHYFEVVNFARHQIINRPSHFAYPKPNHGPLTESSLSTPIVLSEKSGSAPEALIDERERGKRKGKGKERGAGAPGRFENRKMTDERFAPIKDFYIAEFERRNTGVTARFDGRDGKALTELLTAQKSSTAERVIEWLRNALESDVTYPLQANFRMNKFCAHFENFLNGPMRKRAAGPTPIRSAKSDPTEAERLDGLVY